MTTLSCERGTNPGELLSLCLPYLKESIYSDKLEYCPTTSLATFAIACTHESYDCLVVRYNSQIAGVVITCYNTSFFKGFEGNIDFFYVSPEYRGTGVARELVKYAVEQAKNRGATLLYCGCHSGFDDGGRNNQLYVNLFKKHGFMVNGTNLQLFLGE